MFKYKIDFNRHYTRSRKVILSKQRIQLPPCNLYNLYIQIKLRNQVKDRFLQPSLNTRITASPSKSSHMKPMNCNSDKPNIIDGKYIIIKKFKFVSVYSVLVN